MVEAAALSAASAAAAIDGQLWGAKGDVVSLAQRPTDDWT